LKTPGTIETAFDAARDQLDLVAPAVDLIYADAYAALTGDMTAGFVVSTAALLGGQPCTQLAFRKPGVDVQLWIANGDRPLPLKLVLTTTDLLANPQYLVTLNDWNTNPSIDAAMFRFTATADAKRIDFLGSDVTAQATRPNGKE
jgi:hypothetical protein